MLNVTTVSTVTFDKFTVSVMNKSIKIILTDLISVYIKYTRLTTVHHQITDYFTLLLQVVPKQIK